MASPVELSDLPNSSTASNSDLMLLRKGLTDYKCAVSIIRNVDVSAMSPLPGGTAASTDLFMINRIVGGNPTNYQIPFSNVSFPKSTKMWFYNSVVPTGWSAIPNTGDRLLAVADSVNNYDSGGPGSQKGTWQQDGVTLSIQQMPNHRHWGRWGQSQSNSSATYLYGAKDPNSSGDPKFGGDALKGPVLGVVGGQGDNAAHSDDGACLPHNHGNNWRPLANVGILGNKDN
jgi:hypothetical protein